MPQLVTIEINDNIVRNYSDTYADFNRTRSGRLYVLMPIFFITLIFYWLIGKVR